MAVRVSLIHRTTYDYERPIEVGPQVIRLRPAPHNRTPVHSYSLRLKPKEHFCNWQQDPYGNYLARVVIPEKTQRFEVLVNLVVDLEAYNPFDFFLEPHAEHFPFEYEEKDRKNLEPYLKRQEPTARFLKLLSEVKKEKQRTNDFLVELNLLVHRAVDYVIRMEPGVQTPEETLERGKGSCRDSAWLLVQVCRHLGLAARFVSGYLIQLKPDQVPKEGPQGPTEDFTDLHAWAEVYIPGAGWIGLDATSGLLTAEGHIPLSCAPEPSSAAPVEGGVEKVETEFDFEMSVERIVDAPRVTGPYSEEMWKDIVAKGGEVDAVLAAQKLRLTMGGEPTFVSKANPDAAQWNTEALGSEKLEIADRLTRKLAQEWSPGGLLHYGQGKWYPGEPLPRWALSVVSRRDGQALWENQDHFARATDRGAERKDAERFMSALAATLQIADDNLIPAYEDRWYYLWKERRLPLNLTPESNQLDDPLERDRLARIWQQGLDTAVGWVLPLNHDGESFTSSSWEMRDDRCFLIPGDSPLGFRLPLDSVPWVDKKLRDEQVAADPTALKESLPDRHMLQEALKAPARQLGAVRLVQQALNGSPSAMSDEAGAQAPPPNSAWQQAIPQPVDLVRTALCAEVREGKLHVFLPPIHSVDGFLSLSQALEQTCEKTGLKIQLEGYAPPRDERLKLFQVTPDPGVIEVNVPPTQSWPELLEQTQFLYDAAETEGLGAEKFELDGRHVGSGGGNHLVMGAQEPLMSPFLRRPELLRSLLGFWHNHPSLSYLFSGQFIGPTSQSPRVDEARNDAVYELELAFAELDRQKEVQPWLIDRVLRHLLTDVTGNTHRAEFCIDKLYSPDSASGRLGLVEMRGFEMPPHFRMAAAQQLLVRGLLAHFSTHPYREPLVKWGTGLHDRFLLPHFVKQDLKDALSHLGTNRGSLNPAWYEPQYEFRFPRYGSIAKDDLILELRGALEPWHVLGEESGGGGQARYVDSSLERLQVKLIGATPGRHLVCCNGIEVPLHPSGNFGEAVAGVRYRAWQPPSCLHPTIGVDGPLRFDIYDSWNQRAIAGCTYHVSHPGGRANEERPVNAEAAESRRIARFEPAGHTSRSYKPTSQGVNADFPMTLDLRLT